MSLDGLYLVDKESGITSHDVVAMFRRAAKMKKVGHTGTLDPLATGLLILCLGSATRLQSYLTGLGKTYEGEVRFGWATETQDAEGAPVGERIENVDASSLDLDGIFDRFRGEILQTPPAYSSKKVGGRRAHEMARSGEAPELEPRKVEVKDLTVLAVYGPVVRIRIECSAGTYVRTIAHDAGTAAGTGAHLISLRRTRIGSYDLSSSVPSGKLTGMSPEEIADHAAYRSMREIELPLPGLMLDPMQIRAVRHGQEVVVKPPGEDLGTEYADEVALSDARGTLLGIGRVSRVMREGGPLVVQPRVILQS